MRLYDVFKSEGGHRVAGAMWGDDPIARQSPWFATEAEAKEAAIKMRADGERRSKWMPEPDFEITDGQNK